MSESSGFFNARLDVNGEYDRKYLAEQFAEYFSLFIGNGVYINPASQLQVEAVEDQLAITVNTGHAYINGYFYKNDSKLQKTLSNPDGTNPRIDRVVLRLEYGSRSIYVDVLEGISSETPVAKELTRNQEVYELALADVYIASNALSIDQANIEDRRNDSSLCGYVHGAIEQLDVTDLFLQFEAAFNDWFGGKQTDVDNFVENVSISINKWFDELKAHLSGDVAVNLQLQIDDLNTNTFLYYNSMVSKKTIQNDDGTFTEIYPDGATKTTVFDAENEKITETLVMANKVKFVKTTTFDSNGDVTEVVTQ